MTTENAALATIQDDRDEIISEWISELTETAAIRPNLISSAALRNQAEEFLRNFEVALAGGGNDIARPEWSDVKGFLGEVSRERAIQGFTPSETASFILSLKRPLFARLNDRPDMESVRKTWEVNEVLDSLALYTTEVFQKSREDMIRRQQDELLELSTPVLKIWDGVLAIPLIGTLDSERTQVVMESLLEQIVQTGSSVAIIDITGVPTVDTLVAQHLLKTVAAARLMGADCIISGIRPQIAQTIVHLGIELEGAETRATLADAIRLAMARLGWTVRANRD